MPIVNKKIQNILSEKNLSHRQLAKILNDFDSSINAMINEKRPFPPEIIDKICPVLGVSKGEFLSWVVADKYSKESIQTAFNELKNRKNKETLILTQNIDKILTEKNMSRSALSRKINYSQSGVNRIIIGKESMSQKVISKIATILEVSEDTIKGWIIADKYYTKVFKLALNLKNNVA